MGLPLFVARVESDIPHKCPRKPRLASASPPRTGIGRAVRLNQSRLRHSRDRTSTLRRLWALEQNERSINGTAEETPSFSDRFQPTVGRSTVAAHISRRFMESGSDAQDEERELRRNDCVSWFRRLFGPDWHGRDWQRPQQDVIDGNYWYMEEPTRTRDARVVRMDPMRRASDQSIPLTISIVPAPSWPAVDNDDISPNASSDRPAPSRPSRRLLGRSSREEREEIRGQFRQRLAQRMGLETLPNGLGDRVHSPSPEAWDTLLTTLTPDPQPPSANSSFASTAATQTADVSTNTSLSERVPTPGIVPDAPCDSGDEDSDDAEEMSRNRLRRTHSPGLGMRHHFVMPGFEPPGSDLQRDALSAVADYMRRNMHRPAENITVMIGHPEEEAPESRSEDEPWLNSPPNGPLPGYSAVVQATRADAPEADATEHARASIRRRWSFNRQREEAFHRDRLIIDRLQNNEEVPDELWAAAGVRPWARDNRN